MSKAVKLQKLPDREYGLAVALTIRNQGYAAGAWRLVTLLVLVIVEVYLYFDLHARQVKNVAAQQGFDPMFVVIMGVAALMIAAVYHFVKNEIIDEACKGKLQYLHFQQKEWYYHPPTGLTPIPFGRAGYFTQHSEEG